MTGYAEFAVTTNFSFLRGASQGEELVLQAKKLGLTGLGVADRNSVAGVVRAHQAAKEAGLASRSSRMWPCRRCGWASRWSRIIAACTCR
jgi:DNA polymerase III alpha subunit